MGVRHLRRNLVAAFCYVKADDGTRARFLLQKRNERMRDNNQRDIKKKIFTVNY